MESQIHSRKRLKQACKNCRRKKARCPGERPFCSFCARLKQNCEYDDIQPSIEVGEASAIPKQRTTAKLAERVTNRSIDYTPNISPTNTEFPSENIGHAVSAVEQFISIKREPTSSSSPDENGTSNSNISKFQCMPPENIILPAIDKYFQRFHNRPFTFFLEHNFRRDFEAGKLPSHLILSVVANVTHLSSDPWFEGRNIEAAKLIGQQAWLELLTTVLPDESSIDIRAVQSLGLLCQCEYRSGRFQSGSMKLRMALTLAQNLRMTSEPRSNMSPIRQEEQRCLMWTLYVIDKLTSAKIDRKSVLSDKECLLRLPENEEAFQRLSENRMLDLKRAKLMTIPKKSYFAKLVLIASTIGNFVRTPIQGESSDSLPFWHPDGGYAQLHRQMQHITNLCKADMLGPQSALNDLKNQQSGIISDAVPGIGYRLYTQVNYHMLSIAVNHPFFIRQQLSATDAPCPPSFLQQTLKECQEHAEIMTRFATVVQQSDWTAHISMFPGYHTYVAAIVHFLFMHSPDLDLANRSRELFHMAQTILLRNATATGSAQSRAFCAALDAIQPNSGVASLLVDPTVTTFRYRAPATSVWRMMDLNWLGEQLCVSITLTPSPSFFPANLIALQRHQSSTTNSSRDTSNDESPLTPSVPTPQGLPTLSKSRSSEPDHKMLLRKESMVESPISPGTYAFGLPTQNLTIEGHSPLLPDDTNQHPQNYQSPDDSRSYRSQSFTSQPNISSSYDTQPSQCELWQSNPGMGQRSWTDGFYEQSQQQSQALQRLSQPPHHRNHSIATSTPSHFQSHTFDSEYHENFKRSIAMTEYFSGASEIIDPLSRNKRPASTEPY